MQSYKTLCLVFTFALLGRTRLILDRLGRVAARQARAAATVGMQLYGRDDRDYVQRGSFLNRSGIVTLSFAIGTRF